MGAKLRNCPSCGRLFLQTGNQRVCRDCYEKQLEEEERILSYVRDHPKTSIQKVCEALDVREITVMRMVRAGKFMPITKDFSYPCESCGKPILTGRLCADCKKKIQKGIEEVAAHAKAQKERGPGIYSKDFYPSTNNKL